MSGENMTQPNESASKTDRKSSAGKSKAANQVTPSGKALKQSKLDEIAAGKLLAERDGQKLLPSDGTKA
jgi:hypothetical protein